jgi:uncharacterized protein YqfA (UPF0365 family)
MRTLNPEIQLIIIIGIALILILYYLLIARYWLKCLLSGVRISQLEIIFMRFRGTPVELIITELIKSNKSGVLLTRDELEACHLAGGNVSNVVNGLIYAKSIGYKMTIAEAIQLDQQKFDIVNYLKNK